MMFWNGLGTKGENTKLGLMPYSGRTSMCIPTEKAPTNSLHRTRAQPARAGELERWAEK